jgi:hypothetical protein
MRFVVAQRSGRRGEGLGNEIFPWAKGWIASQALDAHLVGPSMGVNKRRYWRNFRSSRLDFVLEDALLRLPHFAFTEEEYLATGKTDFGAAISQWAASLGIARRRFFVVSVGGMWGGYASIRSARQFLWSRLLASRDALGNVYRVVSTLDRSKIFVAVHMRSGGEGFTTSIPGASQRGKFNLQIPGDWYLWVCRVLQERFRDRVQFWFFTDHKNPDCEEAIRRFNPMQSAQAGLTECSDLLLMAQADLRVCSVSSYSLAANFLSGGPYVWYEPQLTLNDGLYTLWGDEEAQKKQGSPTALSKKFLAKISGSSRGGRPMAVNFLGVAMATGNPLPERLIELLEKRLRDHDSRTNLVEYGCVPQVLSRTETHEREQATWSAGQGCSR